MKEYLEYYDNRPYLGKQNIDDNLQDENEYQRAANILIKHIEESGLELSSMMRQLNNAELISLRDTRLKNLQLYQMKKYCSTFLF